MANPATMDGPPLRISLRDQVSNLKLERDMLDVKIKHFQRQCGHLNGFRYIPGNLGKPIYDPGDEYLECIDCGFIR